MTEKQREEAEWENINVLLMMHGLKPLSLVKRTDMKDLIIFDKQSSQTMRENLKTMMEETSRQQNMIQELIETNKQLKNELQQQQSRAADQEQRANDLEQIMESVKSKIGEMEDESVNRVCQQQNKIKELQKEHKVLQPSRVGFPSGSVVKNPPANAGDARDTSFIPGSGRSPNGGNGNPLQCSCLENAMDRGAWRATGRGVTKSWTRLSAHHLLWQTTQCKATKLFCIPLHKSFSFNFFFYFCVGFLYRLQLSEIHREP